MTSKQYAQAFMRYWWVIIVFAVMGLVASAAIVSTSSDTYTASSRVLVSSTATATTTSSEAYESTLLAQQRMASYTDIANSSSLAARILAEHRVDLDQAEVQDRLRVAVPSNSTVLVITAEDTVEARTRNLASWAGTAMAELVNGLERNRSRDRPLLAAKVVAGEVTTAQVPAPAWRNPLLGLAAGLVVGLAAAVIASRLDRRVRDRSSVEEALARPVVASIGRRGLLGRDRKDKGDQLGGLRSTVYFRRSAPDSCLALAVSPVGRDRATERVAGDLAQSLADTGAEVLLVEADLAALRSGGRSDEALASGGGLAGYLGGGDMPTVVERSPRLDVLPAGAHVDDPEQMLHSSAFAEVLEDARKRYDFIVVSAPPGGGASGLQAVAARCDETLVVARTAKTRRDDLERVREQLQSVNASILGAALLR